MAVCPSCGAENREEARFCDSCGASLVAEPARETRKTVTVLFCDVTGSTALGERIDPESLRRVMARYFDVAKEVVERYGCSVEKFIGTGSPTEEARDLRGASGSFCVLESPRPPLLPFFRPTEPAEEAAGESAVAAAGATDYLPLRAYAAMSLAEVERLAGQPEGERAALEEALRLAEQKGDLLRAGRARDRLAEVAPVA